MPNQLNVSNKVGAGAVRAVISPKQPRSAVAGNPHHMDTNVQAKSSLHKAPDLRSLHTARAVSAVVSECVWSNLQLNCDFSEGFSGEPHLALIFNSLARLFPPGHIGPSAQQQ